MFMVRTISKQEDRTGSVPSIHSHGLPDCRLTASLGRGRSTTEPVDGVAFPFQFREHSSHLRSGLHSQPRVVLETGM